MSTESLPENNDYASERLSSSYNKLNIMRRKNRFCDLKLLIGNKTILAHKNILASHSDYFDKLLTDYLPNSLEIKNSGITPNSLEILVEFIYTSQIVIDNFNMLELLVASSFLSLDDVRKKCFLFVSQNIDINNFTIIRDTGNCFEMNDLYDLFFTFTLNHFNSVVKSNEFLSFPFELLMDLLKSDDLCAEEEDVYKSTILWLKHDLEERSKYLPDLLTAIRICLLPKEFLKNNVHEENLIKANLKCMNYLCEIYKAQFLDNTENCETSTLSKSTHRKYNQLKQIKCFDELKPEDFMRIKSSPEFMLLPLEQLVQLIKSDDLLAEEKEVLDATILWVKYDIESRYKFLSTLLQYIRPLLLPLTCLVDVVETTENLIISDSMCVDWLLKAYKVHRYKDHVINVNELNFVGLNLRNRNTIQILLLIDKSNYFSLEWIDFKNHNKYRTTLITDLYELFPCTVLRNGELFGIYLKKNNDEDDKNMILLYDRKLKQWERQNSPNFNHESPSFVQFYDHVYTVFSFRKHNLPTFKYERLETARKEQISYQLFTVLLSVNKTGTFLFSIKMSMEGIEYYDTVKKNWHQVKFKISNIKGLKLVVVSDLIYGVGDSNAFCYNPSTDIGQIICYMTEKRTDFAVCSYQNVLYVIGGCQEINGELVEVKTVEKYDPQSNSWIRIANMNIARRKSGAIEIDSLMYVIGGVNCNTIEYYDHLTDRWVMVNDTLNSSEHCNINAFILGVEAQVHSGNISTFYSSI